MDMAVINRLSNASLTLITTSNTFRDSVNHQTALVRIGSPIKCTKVMNPDATTTLCLEPIPGRMRLKCPLDSLLLLAVYLNSQGITVPVLLRRVHIFILHMLPPLTKRT